MAKKTNEQLVIAIFDNPAAAASAATALQSWDKGNDDVKLGAFGIISKNEKGGIDTKSYGARNTGKGAKAGVILGIIAAVLSGGVTLLGGLVVGGVFGGAVGSLSKHGLGMSPEETQKLASDLEGGKAALVVTCTPEEVAATSAQLTSSGGTVQTHELSEENVAQVAPALEAAAAEAPAADAEAPAMGS